METEADIDAQIDALKAKKLCLGVEALADMVKESRCTSFKAINAFCRDLYGRIPRKGLCLTLNKCNNCRTFIECVDKDNGCGFRIVCRREKRKGSIFTVDKKYTNLEHDGEDPETGEPFTCNSMYKPPAKEILKNPVFLSLKSQAHGSVKSSRETSTKSMQSAITAGTGLVEPTVNAIKKANAAMKYSSQEHIESYNSLRPYCEVAKALNADFMYNIEKDGKDVFQRMAVLFPYSKAVLKDSYNVVGIDAAHMKPTLLNKLTVNDRVKLGLEDMDGSYGVMLQKSMLTFLTGRTLNNEMIVYGYMLGYSENADNLNYFFKFLIDNGLNVNRVDMTIMSDRALAYTTPIQEYFPNALHLLCPLHIKRNLVDNVKGISPGVISQYWKIQQSKTLEDYCEAMDELEYMDNGEQTKKYLSEIHGIWQLYRVIDRGNVIYEMKSDNIVEGAFSWARELRHISSAYFFCEELYCSLVQRINLMKARIEDIPSKEYLTPVAKARVMENSERARYANYSVSISNKNKDAIVGIVTIFKGSPPRKVMYNVDFLARKCECLHWQQSGVPCVHAMSVLQKYPGKSLPTRKEYFYDWCYADALRKTFQDIVLKVPHRGDIKSQALLSPEYILYPAVSFDPNTNSSFTRFASQGDSRGGGGLSQSARGKKKRRICALCTKNVSVSTTHPACACKNHARRRGVKRAFDTYDPFQIKSSDDGCSSDSDSDSAGVSDSNSSAMDVVLECDPSLL